MIERNHPLRPKVDENAHVMTHRLLNTARFRYVSSLLNSQLRHRSRSPYIEQTQPGGAISFPAIVSLAPYKWLRCAREGGGHPSS